jgi:excisionase family DNA binding protein
MDEILTVREVAEYLKLSRTTIWRWVKEGKLQAFKLGRSWRVRRSELERITGQGLRSAD